MAAEPGGRKRVDLSTLPAWARGLLVVATVLLVGGLALLAGRPAGAPDGIPISAVIAALVAFACVGWRAQHRR